MHWVTGVNQGVRPLERSSDCAVRTAWRGTRLTPSGKAPTVFTSIGLKVKAMMLRHSHSQARVFANQGFGLQMLLPPVAMCDTAERPLYSVFGGGLSDYEVTMEDVRRIPFGPK